MTHSHIIIKAKLYKYNLKFKKITFTHVGSFLLKHYQKNTTGLNPAITHVSLRMDLTRYQ